MVRDLARYKLSRQKIYNLNQVSINVQSSVSLRRASLPSPINAHADTIWIFMVVKKRLHLQWSSVDSVLVPVFFVRADPE